MAEAVLETKNLIRTYKEGERPVEVLHGLDFSVRAGEFLTVLGPSGSGKSTLLNLLGLLDRPSSGEIGIFGRPTAALTDEERAAIRCRRLGFVFQFESLLPEFTVLENVMLPGRIAQKLLPENLSELEDRARELLKSVGILKLIDRFPYQISGGECQRASIARALINRPAVLLADEPTGNLDRHNGELVKSIMKELTRSLDVAVVMVTHDERAAQSASRVIHLIDGRIESTEAS